MIVRIIFCIIFCAMDFLPYNLRHKIFLSENFIAEFFEIILFGIINGNKNDPVICQQISCKDQPRIHHIEPVGVIASGGFGIGAGGGA